MGMARPSSLRRERDRSLSHRRLPRAAADDRAILCYLTRAESRPTDSPAPKLFEGAAWKFKWSARGVGSTGSEPLRRRIGPRVVGALTPVSAGRGRERGRWTLRRLAGSRRGLGFVSPCRAEP